MFAALDARWDQTTNDDLAERGRIIDSAHQVNRLWQKTLDELNRRMPPTDAAGTSPSGANPQAFAPSDQPLKIQRSSLHRLRT
jgi:hypothetical protein